MAIIIAMLTTALPWGPVMAFLVSSPLMGPDGFILTTGIIDIRFAIALTGASLLLGLVAGYITHIINKKTLFLNGQARFSHNAKTATHSCTNRELPRKNKVITEYVHDCCTNQSGIKPPHTKTISTDHYSNDCCSVIAGTADTNIGGKTILVHLQLLRKALIETGLKKILLYYSLFVAIGYLINQFVPAAVIIRWFDPDSMLAVPLSALIGLPVYINTESALPLIKTLMINGASPGAMLAFMITGPGTSAGVIAGIAVIMKKKAITLYVMFILFGGIILGYGYDIVLKLISIY